MLRIAFECVDDGNNFGYKPECDSDINQFSTGDLKDITKSGVGTAGREVVVSEDLVVFLIMIALIIGVIAGLLYKFRGILTGKPK